MAKDTYASCTYSSPLGTLTIAASDEGLKGLWIEGQKYFGCGIDRPMGAGNNAHLDAACKWLDDYFAGKNPSTDRLSLAADGTEFRQLVWELLCNIPYGQTRTYGQLAEEAAKRMGKERMSAQATGGAVGHNPISIIVPCHRVVGSDGSLTGYASGIDRKVKLLEHEGVDCSGFYIPAHTTAP